MKKKQVILIIALVIVLIAIACVALFNFRGFISTTLGGRILLKAGKPLQFGSYTVLIDKIEGDKLYGIKVSSKKSKYRIS